MQGSLDVTDCDRSLFHLSERRFRNCRWQRKMKRGFWAQTFMNFTLRQIRYFVGVAESGTISGAARKLSVSQSSVTEAVKELEADLGVLFWNAPAAASR